MRNEEKKNKQTLPPKHFFPGSASLLHSQLLYVFPERANSEWRVVVSPPTAPLCLSFLLTHLSFSCALSSPRASVLQDKPALPWSLQGLQGVPSGVSGAPPPSSLYPLRACRAVPHTSPLTPRCRAALPYPESPQALPWWLQGWVVPCGGAVGAGWNQPCPARGRPLPAPGHLHPVQGIWV